MTMIVNSTVTLAAATLPEILAELQKRDVLPRGRGRPATTEDGARAQIAGLLRRPVGRPRKNAVTAA